MAEICEKTRREQSPIIFYVRWLITKLLNFRRNFIDSMAFLSLKDSQTSLFAISYPKFNAYEEYRIIIFIPFILISLVYLLYYSYLQI